MLHQQWARGLRDTQGMTTWSRRAADGRQGELDVHLAGDWMRLPRAQLRLHGGENIGPFEPGHVLRDALEGVMRAQLPISKPCRESGGQHSPTWIALVLGRLQILSRKALINLHLIVNLRLERKQVVEGH